MLGFASGALNSVRRLDMDVGFDAGERYKSVVERLDKRHLLAGIGREEFFAELHVEVEGVLVALAVHGNEILRSEGGELGEHRLYLAGEYIDATDDEHVIAAAQHLAHPHCGASALARLIDKAGEVAGAVAQYGHGLLAQRGDDQFAYLARSNGFESIGINYLGQEHILPHVGTVLI